MHIDRAMTPKQKCEGEGCAIKEQCWRFRAPNSYPHQDYLPGSPEGRGTLMCEGYYPIRKHDWLCMTGQKKGDHI